MESPEFAVSIIIPVFNKFAFTRQCLSRIERDTPNNLAFEVIVVDNGSTDVTSEFFSQPQSYSFPFQYHSNGANLGFSRANNIGAKLSSAKFLLFLNNDTIVRPGWLEAMVQTAGTDARVGIVGIKQLFPYTNSIHHTGIIFTADGTPQHIYPHADASLSHVNKQREYQAVQGSCLLIARELFLECGMFDESYVNGYEDIDLCLKARERGRTVVCCTKSFIYHYGQITETRTADDESNRARLMDRWRDRIVPDELHYFREDEKEIREGQAQVVAPRAAADDLIYFADDLSTGSALTWATADLIVAAHKQGAPVKIRESQLSPSIEGRKRQILESVMLPRQPVGGIQIRWSHYWPQHLGLDLSGRQNLELFVINYLFSQPGSQPWDYWLQCLSQNHYLKLPLSRFNRDVLLQVGVPSSECHIVRPGYSTEVHDVEPPPRGSGPFRFLTVTNSHDLERYGTKLLLEAYWRTFSASDDRGKGLRRHLWRHDDTRHAEERLPRAGPSGVPDRVHLERGADRAVQVV
jgi:GT2 family glycosyltransferase